MTYKVLGFEPDSDDAVATELVVRFLFGGLSKFRALAFAMSRPIGQSFTAIEMGREETWGPTANFGVVMKKAVSLGMIVDLGMQDGYTHPFARSGSPLWNIVEMAMHVLGVGGAIPNIQPDDIAQVRRRLLRLERSLSDD